LSLLNSLTEFQSSNVNKARVALRIEIERARRAHFFNLNNRHTRRHCRMAGHVHNQSSAVMTVAGGVAV
jgi:hypothetical protein